MRLNLSGKLLLVASVLLMMATSTTTVVVNAESIVAKLNLRINANSTNGGMAPPVSITDGVHGYFALDGSHSQSRDRQNGFYKQGCVLAKVDVNKMEVIKTYVFPNSSSEYSMTSGISDGRYGYFGHYYSYAGNFLSMVDLTLMERVNKLNLGKAGGFYHAMISKKGETGGTNNEQGRTGYFLTSQSPSKIFAVRLGNASAFEEIGSLTLNTGENSAKTAIEDETVAGAAWIITGGDPAIIIKVDLTTMQRDSGDALTLNSGEGDITGSAKYGDFGFLIQNSGPANSYSKVIKVDLKLMQRITAVQTGGRYVDTSGVSYCKAYCAVYFPAQSKLIKVRVGDSTFSTSSISYFSTPDGTGKSWVPINGYYYLAIGWFHSQPPMVYKMQLGEEPPTTTLPPAPPTTSSTTTTTSSTTSSTTSTTTSTTTTSTSTSTTTATTSSSTQVPTTTTTTQATSTSSTTATPTTTTTTISPPPAAASTTNAPASPGGGVGNNKTLSRSLSVSGSGSSSASLVPARNDIPATTITREHSTSWSDVAQQQGAGDASWTKANLMRDSPAMSVASAAAVFSANPAAAVFLARSSQLMTLARCGTEAEGDTTLPDITPPVADSILQLQIGDDRLSYLRGLLVGNAVFFVLFLILNWLAVFAFSVWKQMDIYDAQCEVRFPSLAFLPVIVFVVPTSSAAASVIVYGAFETGNVISVLVGVSFVCIIPFAWACWVAYEIKRCKLVLHSKEETAKLREMADKERVERERQNRIEKAELQHEEEMEKRRKLKRNRRKRRNNNNNNNGDDRISDDDDEEPFVPPPEDELVEDKKNRPWYLRFYFWLSDPIQFWEHAPLTTRHGFVFDGYTLGYFEAIELVVSMCVGSAAGAVYGPSPKSRCLAASIVSLVAICIYVAVIVIKKPMLTNFDLGYDALFSFVTAAMACFVLAAALQPAHVPASSAVEGGLDILGILALVTGFIGSFKLMPAFVALRELFDLWRLRKVMKRRMSTRRHSMFEMPAGSAAAAAAGRRRLSSSSPELRGGGDGEEGLLENYNNNNDDGQNSPTASSSSPFLSPRFSGGGGDQQIGSKKRSAMRTPKSEANRMKMLAPPVNAPPPKFENRSTEETTQLILEQLRRARGNNIMSDIDDDENENNNNNNNNNNNDDDYDENKSVNSHKNSRGGGGGTSSVRSATKSSSNVVAAAAAPVAASSKRTRPKNPRRAVDLSDI